MFCIAKEINTAPFLIFDLIAKSEEGLSKLGLTVEHPLIILESDIPKNVNGISPKMILRGELVDRPTDNINDREAEVLLHNNTNLAIKLKEELKVLFLEKMALTEYGENLDEINSKIIENKNLYAAIEI